MTQRTDLPSGAWIETVEFDEPTERQRRRIMLLLQALSLPARRAIDSSLPAQLDPATGLPIPLDEMLSPADASALFDVNDALAVESLSAWSFPEPITVVALQERRSSDYAAILTAAAPSIRAFFGVDFDPGAPSENGSDANPSKP